MARPIAVVTTLSDIEQARAMARALVERGLAACAQISEIESCYRWDGALHEREREYRVLFKTLAERWPDVERAIRELHPYELPAIHALAFEQVHAPYAAWVESGSGGS